MPQEKQKHKQDNKEALAKAPLWRRLLGGVSLGSVIMLRHWAAWLLTVFAIVMICAYAFLMYVQTPGGRVWLGETVSRLASSDDLQVEIYFDAISFTHVAIPSLTAADKKGLFLRVQDIDLSINPKTYFVFRPVVDRLNIDQVYLARLPDLPEEKPAVAAPKKEMGLPDIAAHLQEFNIREIHAGADVYGQEQFFSLKSRITLSPRLEENNIDIELGAAPGRQKSDLTHMHLRVSANENENLNVDMALRDAAGGMVTHLMGLPKGYDIDFSLQGEGPARDWAGTAQLRLGRELSGHFLLQLKNNQRLLL
ncbi:MAG: hypothetical protein RBS08_04695, partial [Bdellovibrionales bacterium]|nr:hypothetical protein [Bdellovibrionales bacterium]